MFLTHCASVDCVNSDSCSEVMTQSGHVFFCATTVVCNVTDCIARDDRGLVVESLLCVTQVV